MRPSGLFNAESRQRVPHGRGTRRRHVHVARRPADLLLRQATDDTWVRKAVAIATTENTPTMMQMLRSEAVGAK